MLVEGAGRDSMGRIKVGTDGLVRIGSESRSVAEPVQSRTGLPALRSRAEDSADAASRGVAFS